MKVPSDHLWADQNVDRERVDAFAEASPEEQLSVLTYYRREAESRAVEIESAGWAVSFVIFAVFAGNASNTLNWSKIMSASNWSLQLLVAGSVLVSVIGIGWLIRRSIKSADYDRTTAAIWLAAYEEELARRHTARGRKARRWQESHPINWS